MARLEAAVKTADVVCREMDGGRFERRLQLRGGARGSVTSELQLFDGDV